MRFTTVVIICRTYSVETTFGSKEHQALPNRTDKQPMKDGNSCSSSSSGLASTQPPLNKKSTEVSIDSRMGMSLVALSFCFFHVPLRSQNFRRVIGDEKEPSLPIWRAQILVTTQVCVPISANEYSINDGKICLFDSGPIPGNMRHVPWFLLRGFDDNLGESQNHALTNKGHKNVTLNASFLSLLPPRKAST